MSSWRAVAQVAEVPPRRGLVIELPHQPVLAVFVAEGVARVIENRCPHRDGDLGAGDVVGDRVFCPVHAWPFDLATGICPTHPAASVRTFPARIQGTAIEALLDDDQPVNNPDAPVFEDAP